MNKLLLLLPLALAGCFDPTTPATYEVAQRLCKDNGGLSFMEPPYTSMSDRTTIEAVCKDNTYYEHSYKNTPHE